jgi:hypothetical protein
MPERMILCPGCRTAVLDRDYYEHAQRCQAALAATYKEKNRMKVGTILLECVMIATVLVCSACSHHGPKPPPGHHKYPVVDIDPTVKWSAVTTTCDGATVVPDGYNVYIASGTTVPTFQSVATEIPCGTRTYVDTSQIQPKNTAIIPISACVAGVCSFATTLPKGTYTVAVEGVYQGGQGIVSNMLTFSVVPRTNAPNGLTVTP